jgi:transposase
MDLGDKRNHVCALDAAGEVVFEGSVACTESRLRELFGAWAPSLIAIEAGTHSLWVSRVLEELGHTVLVAHPRKLRAIYQSDRKSDVRDAEMLARIARADPKLLNPIRHRGGNAQAHLAIVKARDCLVATRTKLVNHVRGTVKTFGVRLPKCSTPAFHKKALDAIPEALRPALEPILETIGKLTQTIRQYDADIAQLCQDAYPETEILRSVNGVGPVTSLSFILTLEEPHRFNRSRNVPAFIGLTPRRDQSGATDRQLGITKSGNTYLRKLLIGCAQYILGPFGNDSQLRQWGLRLIERGGPNAKKRAVTAVARKLAVLLHRLWLTGMLYEPFPNRTQDASQSQAGAST